jgi:hypothetical protein
MTAATHSLTSATPERPSAVASYGHMLGPASAQSKMPRCLR